jgi:hypothetical protein
MCDDLGEMMQSVFLSNISPDNFTRVSHEFLIHSIYNNLDKAKEDLRKELDATEKLVAQLAMELLIERMSLEEACTAVKLKVRTKHKALPEYWRMAARKKLEDERKWPTVLAINGMDEGFLFVDANVLSIL